MAPPKKRAAAPAGTSRKPAQKAPAEKPEPKKTQAVVAAAQTGGAVASADLMDMMGEFAGEGISTNPRDFLISMIGILQPLSPQVMRDKPETYMDGAEPGHIWLKNALEDPLQGDIWYQPCYHYRKWVEWIPRKQGGGFVAAYDHKGQEAPPAELNARQYRDPENPKALRWKMPNGNDLVDTQYYLGYVLEEDGSKARQYLFPLASTFHTFGKALMTAANQRLIPEGRYKGQRAPIWSSMYHVVTALKKNVSGEWYIPKLADSDNVRWVSQEQFALGHQLKQAFETGAVKADYESQENAGNAGGSGDDRM
jgi:hypothetical protein